MPTCLLIYLVKFHPKVQVQEDWSQRVTGFMYYAEEADTTFSHHSLLYISQ